MNQPIRILLVEDNPGDAELTRDTLGQGRLSLDIDVAIDGAQAVDFLLRRNLHTAAVVPDLVILDLNLPKLGGLQVLALIRKEPALHALPVVVLTSSEAERDIVETYRSGANCYITKPVGLAAYQDIVRSIEDFWFNTAKLPPKLN